MLTHAHARTHTQLHENAGNMFRQGWFQVEATATIPNSLNLDVPFLSADMGSQYLRTVTDISRTPPAVNAAAGEGEGAGSASRTIHFMPLVSAYCAIGCYLGVS